MVHLPFVLQSCSQICLIKSDSVQRFLIECTIRQSEQGWLFAAMETWASCKGSYTANFGQDFPGALCQNEVWCRSHPAPSLSELFMKKLMLCWRQKLKRTQTEGGGGILSWTPSGAGPVQCFLNYKWRTEEVLHLDTVISVGVLSCVQVEELLGSTPQFVLHVQLCVLQGHLHAYFKTFWRPVKCDFPVYLCMK